MTASEALISVVVLAYGEEAWLSSCLEAVLASSTPVEVLLVDNGCENPVISDWASRDRVTLIRPADNLGFTGGCNEAARHARGDFIALVNSDAIVDPKALEALRDACAAPEIGAACASLRLADRPELINSAGNPIHFTGTTWAGSFGEPADEHGVATDIPVATGAAMMLRREVWERLGGFSTELFAYHEDTELSWRCWQQGLKVRYEPRAMVLHHYEFSRHASKMYLVERNRLIFLLTLMQGRTLALLAPMLVLHELGMIVLATLQGWAPSKLRGWRWIVAHRRWVRARRATFRAERRIEDGDLTPYITGTISPANVPVPAPLVVLNVLYRAWWAVTRPLLRTSATKGQHAR